MNLTVNKSQVDIIKTEELCYTRSPEMSLTLSRDLGELFYYVKTLTMALRNHSTKRKHKLPQDWMAQMLAMLLPVSKQDEEQVRLVEQVKGPVPINIRLYQTFQGLFKL